MFMALAEFIINLADKNGTEDKFRKALQKNGAEFPVSDLLNNCIYTFLVRIHCCTSYVITCMHEAVCELYCNNYTAIISYWYNY